MKEYSIMFVCHGNICRSPMAEFIMKKLCRDAGILERIRIASSAISSEEIRRGVGNPIYPKAADTLIRHGIPFERRRAVLLTAEDYEKYDIFVCMDEENLFGINRIFGSDPDGKIIKLLKLCSSDADVPDPWYCGNFESVYVSILAGCEALLNRILKQLL